MGAINILMVISLWYGAGQGRTTALDTIDFPSLQDCQDAIPIMRNQIARQFDIPGDKLVLECLEIRPLRAPGDR